MKKVITASGIMFSLPLVSFAQQTIDDVEVSAYIFNTITFVNNVIIPAILAIAFLVFIWGIFQYFIAGAADEDKRNSGKQLMLWGLIGFVVIIVVVGIVNLLAGATGLEGDQGGVETPNLPGAAG